MESIYLIIYFIIIGIAATIIYKTKKNGNLSTITIMLVALYLGILSLISPLVAESNNLLQKIAFSILYSFQCIYVGQDFEYINSQLILGNYTWFYKAILYLSFVLAPMLTTGFVLSFIETFVHGIHCRLALLNPFNKNIHVFSNINEDSVSYAENIKQKKSIFIFCNEKDENIKESLKERIRNIDAISTPYSDKNIKIRNKNYYFYEMSDNEIANTENALSIINKYPNNDRIKVSIFSTRKEAQLLLDSNNKRKIKVFLIDRNKYALYNLFLNKPIIKYAGDNVISVLLMGEEDRVLEMIKISLWSMQLEKFELKINIIGNNANHIKLRLFRDCPGLDDKKYKIYFYQADIQTTESIEVMDKYCQDTDYIIMGYRDDGLSVDTAFFLRRYFLYSDKKTYSHMPQINMWLNNEINGLDELGVMEKNYLIGKEKNEKIFYKIDSFGTREQLYRDLAKYNSELEEHSLLCHLANVGALNNSEEEGMEKDILNYYNRQRTREYSIAMAIHMKNLLYTLGIDTYDSKITDEMIEKVERLLEDEKVLNSMMASDTAMWNCYNRGQGFQKISFDEVPKYYQKVTTIFQHTMAKLNPCLTDFDQYEKHEDDTERLFDHRYSYIKAEKKYILYYPKILRKLKEKGF